MLIPNERGLENALELRDRFDEINVFLSASETHNRKNVNRSVEESLSRPGAGAAAAPATPGCAARAVISVAFGCPYEGRVEPERGVRDRPAPGRRRRRRRSASATPPGWPTRVQVREFFEAARERLARTSS